MATRFYFDATLLASVSPAFGGGWSQSTTPIRRALLTGPGSGILAAQTTFPPVGLGITFNQVGQWICARPLRTQQISGTIKGQVSCNESSAAMNATLAIRVAKCDPDGSNVVEILAISASDDNTATPPEMVVTTNTNRQCLDSSETTPITLTPTTVNTGDLLIVELGCRSNSDSVLRSANFQIKRDTSADLPEDNTSTANLNPWVEFSMDLAFQQFNLVRP